MSKSPGSPSGNYGKSPKSGEQKSGKKGKSKSPAHAILSSAKGLLGMKKSSSKTLDFSDNPSCSETGQGVGGKFKSYPALERGSVTTPYTDSMEYSTLLNPRDAMNEYFNEFSDPETTTDSFSRLNMSAESDSSLTDDRISYPFRGIYYPEEGYPDLEHSPPPLPPRNLELQDRLSSPTLLSPAEKSPKKSPKKSPTKSPLKIIEMIVESTFPKQDYKLAKSPNKTYVKEIFKYEALPVVQPAEKPEPAEKSKAPAVKPKSKSPKQKSIKSHKKYEKEEEPVILTKYTGTGRIFIEEMFPSAAFTLDKPPENWQVPAGFIHNLIVPPRSPTDPTSVFEPDPRSDLLKDPINYEYDPESVYKEGRLYLRREYINSYRPVYTVLLENGTLLVYELDGSNKTSDNPTFAYYLKLCSMKKKGDRWAHFFSLKVHDAISSIRLNFQAENEVKRNEWTEAVRRIMGNMTRTRASNCSTLEEGLAEYGIDLSTDSFRMLKVLGRGSFGKIVLCRNLQDNRHYAMKVMRKDVIFQKNAVEAVCYENRMLRSYKNGFLQRMKYCFTNEDLVVFVMDFVNGGSLDQYVLGKRRHSPAIAAFYGLQLGIAIMYLHSHSILLRSLTLHSIHLDHEGNLKLTDYGMSLSYLHNKRHNWDARQHPSYVAPELIQDRPYSLSVDWWSYGICFYIMVTGTELFVKDTEMEVYQAIIDEEITYPDMSIKAEDFLRKILVKDPDHRLGCQGNEEEILEQEIFIPLLYNLGKTSIPAPIKPSVRSEDDTSMFSEFYLKQDVTLTPPTKEQRQYIIQKNKELPEAFNDLISYEASSTETSSVITNFTE